MNAIATAAQRLPATADSREHDEQQQYLTFMLSGETYAISILRQSIGVMVDAVNAVLDIPGSEIEPAPTFGTNIRADFIAGMGKVNGHFVIILNIQSVLSMDDMEALVSIGSSSAAPAVDSALVG
jgi:chemotaxis signal transduction protein